MFNKTELDMQRIEALWLLRYTEADLFVTFMFSDHLTLYVAWFQQTDRQN